ncbi:MAG: hypothetical protein WCT40_02475 [Candidatus Magasanikbacteria bacterium]
MTINNHGHTATHQALAGHSAPTGQGEKMEATKRDDGHKLTVEQVKEIFDLLSKLLGMVFSGVFQWNPEKTIDALQRIIAGDHVITESWGWSTPVWPSFHLLFDSVNVLEPGQRRYHYQWEVVADNATYFGGGGKRWADELELVAVPKLLPPGGLWEVLLHEGALPYCDLIAIAQDYRDKPSWLAQYTPAKEITVVAGTALQKHDEYYNKTNIVIPWVPMGIESPHNLGHDLRKVGMGETYMPRFYVRRRRPT